MNLIGPELVRDLVTLIGGAGIQPGRPGRGAGERQPGVPVPHVDLTKVAGVHRRSGQGGQPGDASLGMLWHKLSELPAVTIAKIRGRARGAGSELALACDMRFAARENAIFGQIEVGVGATPGAGGVQHLARLLGRGRAMEVDPRRRRLRRRGGRTVRLDQPGPARRRPRRVRGPARPAHRVVPRRCGAIGQAGTQRADHARRGRDPRRRRPVPPAGRLGRGPGPHQPPCSPRDCRPAARSNSTSVTASEPYNRRRPGIQAVRP